MTVHAVLPYGRMLEQEGAALFLVAAKTGFIHRGLHKQALERAAVRIMTVGAGDFTLEQRHVRAPAKFRPLGLMAPETSLMNTGLGQKPTFREIGHRVVAIGAGYVGALMDRSHPMDPASRLVTAEALCILLWNRRFTQTGIADDVGQVRGVFHVGRARTVTSFALGRLKIRSRVACENLGMDRMRPMLAGLHMAIRTNDGTHIFTCGLSVRIRRLKFDATKKQRRHRQQQHSRNQHPKGKTRKSLQHFLNALAVHIRHHSRRVERAILREKR